MTMVQEKFETLQTNYLKREAQIQQTREKCEEEKIQTSNFVGIFISIKYFFILWALKLNAKVRNRRYLKKVEQKKRFTLTLAGESFWKKFWVKLGQGIFLFIMVIIIIFPFYWMLMTSFKPFDDVQPTLKETLWPKHWSLEAYQELFKYVDSGGATQTIKIGRYFWNTIYISFLSTITQTAVSLLGGFAIFNWKTKLNPIFMGIMFSLIMIPGEAMLLGRFIFAVQLGWRDNILALIVPYIGNVYTIYLMSNAFSVTGKDLKKASKVDGLSTFKYFYKIAVPAIKSTIVTTMIISFIEGWNSTLWPVMIMKDGSQHATIPMLLYGIINITGGDIDPIRLSGLQNPVNFKMAASVLSILPIVLVFIIFNKPIIRGISNRGGARATKG